MGTDSSIESSMTAEGRSLQGGRIEQKGKRVMVIDMDMKNIMVTSGGRCVKGN